MRVLVTGAAGGLGSHLVEAFVAHGHTVTGLARTPESLRHLRGLPARFVLADLRRPASLPASAFAQDCVVHTVSRVALTGGWPEHRDAGPVAAANALAAAVRAGCPRFLHLSSIAVYDLPADGGRVGESAPLQRRPRPWNHYARAKLLSEEVVRRAGSGGSIRTTILRPSICLGRYDRHTTPRLLRLLRSRLAGIIGDGDNTIPCVDLSELAELVVAAGGSARAAGGTYNVSGRSGLSLRRLLEIHAEALGRPLPRRVPRRLARCLAAGLDAGARLAGRRVEPPLTRFLVEAASLNCEIDCSRATEDLGWAGDGDLVAAIGQAVAWQRKGQAWRSCRSSTLCRTGW